MKPLPRRHLIVVPAILLAWVALVFARLVDLQVLQYDFFTRRARRQQERTVEVSPVRGMIYDRNLRPLAMSIEVESVFAVPTEIPNPESTAKLLAPVLDLDPAEVRRKLQGTRFFRWIKRKVSAREADRIRQLNLKGVYFQKESKRFYPKREMAAHVLGHVGMDDNGLAGVELRYEKSIRGRPGQLIIEKDARQRWFSRSGRPPEAGENLVLTLDENIQYIVERELDAAMEQTRALSGSVVVQDPFTGEILAMASRPTFNPNTYGETDPEAFRNMAVSAAFEPGSTLKIFTAAAVLEEGLAHPEEYIDCQMGQITLAGHTIRDHKPFSLLNVGEILQYSSDVGIIKLAMRLGDEGLHRYLRDFGFGAPTGIGLPGESRGLTKPPERWSRVSIGSISMGQEIGVTPIQLVSAASAIVNGGRWFRPRIVKEQAPAGNLRKGEAGDSRRIIGEDTAAILRRMMVKVVTDGTAQEAQLARYTAAGKTGTAQKIDPATGAYSLTDYVASFVGFAPAESPVFTILVVIDSPRGKKHGGGNVAAPIFKRIAEQALAYQNVPATEPWEAAPAPSLAAADSDFPVRSPSILPSQRRGTGLAGDGLPESEAVAASLPLARREPPTGTHNGPPGRMRPSTLVTLDSSLTVPNFFGKTVRAVVEQSLAKGLELQVVGSGVAYEQFPLPNLSLPEGRKIVVRFRVGGRTREQQPAEAEAEKNKRPAMRLPVAGSAQQDTTVPAAG
ncbi:MAG: penicillin-binding transpeptidase domain-containing protein [Acidobacteria bacterium]|nr:penicillin-binding transpeptidase domain-containing protein [Acidobacteriota bacterium]